MAVPVRPRIRLIAMGLEGSVASRMERLTCPENS